MDTTLYGKVTIYTEGDFDRRASVYLKQDGSLDCVEYRKELYTDDTSFREAHNYTVMVVSNEAIRRALAEKGFNVKDSERVNAPLHLMLPLWQIKQLDELCRTEYFNHSRSDLINKILHDSMPSIPPEYAYEKGMAKTTFTIHPTVLSEIEPLCEGTRSLNHLIYDYVTYFLERNTCAD